MKNQSYKPSKKLLEKYSDVLVNFALNSGRGVKKGEVVMCVVPDVAKDMALALQNIILKAGAQPIIRLIPTGFSKDFFDLANDEQLSFFPKKYLKARSDLIDHQIGIIADPFPFELKNTDPKKIIKSRDSNKLYRDWLDKKENNQKYTWTVALFGVEAKAKEVGLSLKSYWQQIIKACFLDKKNPISEWQKVYLLQEEIKLKLNKLKIEHLLIKGVDVDLKIKIGSDRVWNGGGGRNIPSFEIFTSPDWREVNGWIKFNEPLYRYGNLIKDVHLEIKNGLVIKAQAKKGNEFLQEMLKSKNADKIGEFSLTDKRASRITHPMAETLFDENVGGPFGNMHLAIGKAYQDCFRGDASKVDKKQWKKMGFNDSAEHCDIVSTTDRTVTAVLADGKEQVIYKRGKFII
jgi:aminopeptidase